MKVENRVVSPLFYSVYVLIILAGMLVVPKGAQAAQCKMTVNAYNNDKTAYLGGRLHRQYKFRYRYDCWGRGLYLGPIGYVGVNDHGNGARGIPSSRAKKYRNNCGFVGACFTKYIYLPVRAGRVKTCRYVSGVLFTTTEGFVDGTSDINRGTKVCKTLTPK